MYTILRLFLNFWLKILDRLSAKNPNHLTLSNLSVCLNNFLYTGVSKRSTVAFVCYFLVQWCYFLFFWQSGEKCAIFSRVLAMLKLTGKCTIWGLKCQNFLGANPLTPYCRGDPSGTHPLATVNQGALRQRLVTDTPAIHFCMQSDI